MLNNTAEYYDSANFACDSDLDKTMIKEDFINSGVGGENGTFVLTNFQQYLL